jgi:hypothetical protein
LNATEEQAAEFAAQFDEFGMEKTLEMEPTMGVQKGANVGMFVLVSI